MPNNWRCIPRCTGSSANNTTPKVNQGINKSGVIMAGSAAAFGLRSDLHQGYEVIYFERSAADQRAVNLRLHHKFMHIIGLDAASILNSDDLSVFLAVQHAKHAANRVLDNG